jgi:DNA-binding NtrC family response regulator
MALAIAIEDDSEVDRLWREANARTRGVGTWYRLRATHTRVRGLIRRRRPGEARELAQQGLAEAQESKNAFFEFVFELSLADLVNAGEEALVPIELGANAESSLGLVGARRRIIAKALAKSGNIRGISLSEAAARILFAAGAHFEWGGTEPAETRESKSEGAQLEALDDAVALLELAGYPHVLAREAYALLDLSGAAVAQALLARSEAGVRVVAARGWTDAEAATVAAEPGDRLRITCGVHRDETWEILAEPKPALNDRCTAVAVRKLVDTAVTLDRYRRDEKQRAALWPADTLETDGGLWISEQMAELLSIARRVASSDVTVLLTGETGTGKEVLARAIHRASGRSAKPFVPFNCTAVPREMLESQLFGYRKGAFTGADNAFEGVIRAAAGGTIFLDEIAEIAPELQPKLLRFLETHEVHGLGEAQPVKVDVRIVAATNADLETLVAEGRFREDLFYRLNVVRLRLPPLRERREEIPPLIDHYLRKFADEQKKGRLTLDDETLEYLVLYSWPGNVRQLVNEISRVVAYAEPDGTVTPALLSPEIQASRRTVRVLPGDEPEMRVRLDQPLNDAVEAIEQVMILRALDRAHGNYENAARLLGISRKGLFLKRRRWGLRRPAQAS